MQHVNRQFLCRHDTIPDGGSKGATLSVAGGERDIFLVRRGEHVFAYENSCPHTGATLNFQPDQFMSFDNDYIQCSIHGAQFHIHDGYCVYGPCMGMSLRRVDVEVSDGAVIARWTD